LVYAVLINASIYFLLFASFAARSIYLACSFLSICASLSSTYRLFLIKLYSVSFFSYLIIDRTVFFNYNISFSCYIYLYAYFCFISFIFASI
jgi:hypothetical protein